MIYAHEHESDRGGDGWNGQMLPFHAYFNCADWLYFLEFKDN